MWWKQQGLLSGQQINRKASETCVFYLELQEVCEVQPSQNIAEESVLFYKDSSIKTIFSL